MAIVQHRRDSENATCRVLVVPQSAHDTHRASQVEFHTWVHFYRFYFIDFGGFTVGHHIYAEISEVPRIPEKGLQQFGENRLV